MSSGWIGVDLDGTLAQYDAWKGAAYIGAPIPRMVERVRQWLAEGRDVRIFTARVWYPDGNSQRQFEVQQSRQAIESWCIEQFGQVLPVTCCKDFAMIELWDDRCVQVIPNTGIAMQEMVKA